MRCSPKNSRTIPRFMLLLKLLKFYHITALFLFFPPLFSFPNTDVIPCPCWKRWKAPVEENNLELLCEKCFRFLCVSPPPPTFLSFKNNKKNVCTQQVLSIGYKDILKQRAFCFSLSKHAWCKMKYFIHIIYTTFYGHWNSFHNLKKSYDIFTSFYSLILLFTSSH